MQLRHMIGACAGLFLASAASAQVVTTVVNNGPTAELYDMVILGDGYRAAEQAQFNQDVADVVDFFQNDPGKFPYGDYFFCYNVHSVFRASVESGADDPCANPPVTRNTVYDAEYCWGGTQRCLYIRNTAAAAADVALAPDTDGRVIVLVNDSQYGGCASTYAVSYNGASMEEVNAHEWGHSFGLVADEYDYGNTGPYVGGEPTDINCTASTTGNAKWPLWVGSAGQYGTVGAYPGACYYPPTPLPTLYRPEPNCEMRALGLRFCTICREQFIKRFNDEVFMINNAARSPAAGSIAQFGTITFSFANRLANRPNTIEWRIDGGAYFAGTTIFQWNVGAAAVGNHTISLRLTDTSTEVRNDPGNLLVHTFSWVVNVTAGAQTARCNVNEVVPSAYTTVEANNSSGFPFGSGLERRVMMAYGGTALGASAPVRFDGIQFRPNGGITSTAAASYRFTMYCSTSRNPAQNLNHTFDLNHGADRTLVFSGTLGVPATSTSGTPAEWLLHVPFSRSFEWDPSSGPLLVDIRYISASGVATASWDGPFNTTDDCGRIVHQSDSSATTADFPATGTQEFALTARLCVECEVAPNAYATAEAGSASQHPWSSPAAGGQSRTMMAYDGSVFPPTFDGRFRVSRISFRPDSGGSVAAAIYDMQISMSTGVTPANALSATFNANHGADRRVVFDGIYSARPASGGTSPAGFDFPVELSSSFDYQPSAGPLVIDVVIRGRTGAQTVSWDGPFNTGELVGRVFASTATATTGTSQNFALVLCVSGERCPTLPEARDGSFSSSSAYPWGGTQPMRAQYVYDDAALATTEPIYIQHLRWRPASGSASIGPVTYDVRIELSTSPLATASALTTTFGANHGANRTVVFDGQFSVPLTNLSGNPRDFPIRVQLDTPFLWTPTSGPLVVDLIYRGATGTGLRLCDGSFNTDPVYRVAHLSNPNATVADFGPQQFALALSLCGVNCNALAVNYGVACAGTNGTPINTTDGLPSIPNPTFAYRLAQGPIGQLAGLWLGFSPVSINLTGAGATGCFLYNPIDLAAFTVATNGSGQAVIPSPIPLDPLIDGATVYSQWIAIDPGAPRPLTVVLTDGQRITLCF